MTRLLLTLLVASTLALGCSDDESTGSTAPGSHEPCSQEPWACPAGETCWVDYEMTDFVCQASGPGEAGDDCVNLRGQPTCADALGCRHVVGEPGGQCVGFCDPVDPDLACPEGMACRPVLYRLTTGPATLHLCDPGGTAGAGGASGEGGGAGAGGG